MVAPIKTWGMSGKELLKLEKELKNFAGREYPIINGMALNKTAYETSQEYKRIAARRFTMRNKWTLGSIGYNKVSGLNPMNQESSAGSTAQYMADQEFGTVRKTRGSKGIAIPTTTASNEPFSARPRKKVVARAKRRGNIRLTKTKVRANSRKQHIFQTIRAVSMRGSGNYAYLPIHNAKGIYRITGKGQRAKIKMIYSLEEKSITIKKAPSLAPAVDNIVPRMGQFYIEAAERRVKKSFSF